MSEPTGVDSKLIVEAESLEEVFEVVRLGHPVLRKVAEEVPQSEFGTPGFRRFAKLLLATMVDANGLGLAAPQVADSARCFAYFVPSMDGSFEVEPRILVNPKIQPTSLDRYLGWEGCLSIPGLRGLVPRFEEIEVEAFDIEGNPLKFVARDFHARVIQHEFDHLEGVIFLDRMKDMESLAFEEEWEYYVLGEDEEDEEDESAED